MSNYSEILSRRYKGRVYTFPNPDDYDSIIIHDGQPKPTLAELDALWPEVANEMLEEAERIDRINQLKDHGGKMLKLYEGLPVPAQLQFGTVMAQVYVFLQSGNGTAARAAIEAVDPGDYAAIKEQLLAL